MTEITGLAELLLARIAETRAAAVGLSPMESPGAPEPVEAASPRPRRYSQCDGTCTVDCGHCKGAGRPPSDLERLAQIEMLAHEMHRAVEGIPFTAPECFPEFARSAGAAITELLAQVRRRDAAIQAVRDVLDLPFLHELVSIQRIRAAIAAELEGS